jgi:hypothetical protein
MGDRDALAARRVLADRDQAPGPIATNARGVTAALGAGGVAMPLRDTKRPMEVRSDTASPSTGGGHRQ